MDPTTTQTTTPAYPLADAGPDVRFTHALLFDIAEVLHRHGYPKPAGADWTDLTLALSRFLYQNRQTS